MLVKLDFTLYRPVLPSPKSSPHCSGLGASFFGSYLCTHRHSPFPFDTEFAGSPAITASPRGHGGALHYQQAQATRTLEQGVLKSTRLWRNSHSGQGKAALIR
jgi:hypothetical protein